MFSTERKIQVAFAIALILICVVGAMSYLSLARLRDDVARVMHSQNMIASLESLFSAVTDSVAAQRGYIITGQQGYLEIYRTAKRAAEADLQSLQGLVADNPAQQKRLEALAGLVAERAKISESFTEARTQRGPETARALVAKGSGNDLHNRIRSLIDEIQNAETMLLREREGQADRASSAARGVILGGSLLAFLIVAAALFFIGRDFSGRRRADAELQNMVGRLEDGVRERTADLAKANQSLATGEARLQGILESAMDAIITIDERQDIVLFNAAAQEIFRCRAGQAIGKPLDRFIPERFRAAHRAHVERFGSTGTTMRVMGARLELFGLRADGEEFPIDASISQVLADGKRYYTVILRDVTERKKAESELRHAYHEWRAAVEQMTAIIHSAMDAVVTIDQDQRIVLFNAAAERIFQCNSRDAMGQPLDRFIPERFRAAHRAHIERFGETRVTTRMMGSQLALSGLRSNGEEFPIDASISQVTVEGKKLYTVILRDITERKRAQDQLERSYRELRELSAAMNEVREAERLRIARELHDELAQWLTAIKMDVSWLASRLPEDQPRLLERTERMRGLVDTTVAAVRRIASDLRPVMLDDLGLVAALEHLLHDLSQRTGVIVSLETEESGTDVGEPLASALYRIVQEALTNVARHAGASEARVGLRLDGDDLVLIVVDNGKGIDLEATARSKSYGIMGIRERASTLGGKALISRLESGGTRIEVVVPLTRYRERKEANDPGSAG